uniref:Uncharacterized protein n=2 Tax=Vibrio TaxID=662 RepID=A0A0H3ZTY9_9VIBR|nr:hypothetical protein [Vibrio tasmaniensis]
MGDIDKKTNDSITKQEKKVDDFISTVTPAAIDAEGRFYVDITVKGDKDTYYPVYFKMPSSDPLKIDIYRHYSWNSKKATASERSDFDVSHVSGVLVSLIGQAYSWTGNSNFLSTLINRQRYMRTVANVGFSGYASAHKVDPDLPDTTYVPKSTGFICPSRSSFHLRGGNLKYRIYSNFKMTFGVKQQGDVIDTYASANINTQWRAVELSVADAVVGDAQNDHQGFYLSYPSAADTKDATQDADIDALAARVAALEAK